MEQKKNVISHFSLTFLTGCRGNIFTVKETKTNVVVVDGFLKFFF